MASRIWQHCFSLVIINQLRISLKKMAQCPRTLSSGFTEIVTSPCTKWVPCALRLWRAHLQETEETAVCPYLKSVRDRVTPDDPSGRPAPRLWGGSRTTASGFHSAI